jgi:D-aminopeptidase
MRLSDLGLRIGHLEPGRENALTDVDGVEICHLTINEDGLSTGLSAVMPHPPAVKQRRLYMGHCALDSGDGMTGLGVEEDFGTFSSPIVLTPAPAVGRVYEGVIRYGIKRDPGLDTNTGWPPVVVGVDDSSWNAAPLIHQKIGEGHVEQLLAQVGIGRGLAAFGFKGGVGTASRRTGEYTL